MPSNNLARSATDANVSGIAESRVLTDRPAQIPPVYAATSRRTNRLLSSLYIAGSNIPAHRREAAAMEPQFTIGQPVAQNEPLLFATYAAWARYPRLNIS